MSEQLNVDTIRATIYNSNINHHNQRIDDSGFLPIQEIQTADISRVLTKETLLTSSTSLTTSNSNSPTNLASFEDDEEDNTSLFEFLYDETTNGDINNNGSGSAGGELLSLPLSTLELPVTPPVDEQEQQLKQAAVAAAQQVPQVQSGLLPIETCAATLLTPYSTAVSLSASSSDNTLSNNLNSSNYSSSNSLALSTAAAIAQQSSSGAILPGGIINSNNLLNLSDIPTSLSLAAPKNTNISPKKKGGRARSNSKTSNKKKSPKKKAVKKKAAPTTTKKPLRRPRTVTISNSVGSLMQPIINNNNNMDNQEGSPDDVAPPQVTSGIAPATHAVAAQQGLYHPPRPQTSASNTVSTLSPATGNIENTGRWTAEEHRLFLQGLEQHGKGWKKIATLIKSRTVVQIRTHAQKYFQKLAKARQNGEAVPVQQGVGGQHQVQVSAQVNSHHHAPLGVDGQPVVTMRTTTNPISSQYPGTTQNMALGNDPASLAAAAGNINIATGAPYTQARGRKRRSNTVPGGTKRRVIGNVVRSAVREGRNVKRQKIAEAKRNAVKGTEATAASAPSSLPSIKEDVPGKFEVPNPLPAVSQVLDPYVVTTEMAPPPANAPITTGAANPKNQIVRGRQQLVNTATHGTLPMAALEDAVFRLLTPAGGGPAPGQGQANGTVVNPLAAQAKIAVSHTQYGHPSSSGNPTPPTTVTTTVGTTVNPSPTGVADMLLPGWVDTKNPPQWYADGGDIDTLLEDAEALNWLSDTGDLNETYPPAMVEPTAVSSSSSTAVPSIASIEPNPVGAVTAPQQQDPTGGVVHPSADSLSFLMDPPESQPQPPAPNAAVPPPKQLPTFLEDPPAPPVEQPPTSATEALMADNTSSATEGIPKLAGVGESVTNLMGFPDVDMGDEQAFVSALLDNKGESTMSFPKLSSVGALNSHGSEDKTEEK